MYWANEVLTNVHEKKKMFKPNLEGATNDEHKLEIE